MTDLLPPTEPQTKEEADKPGETGYEKTPREAYKSFSEKVMAARGDMEIGRELYERALKRLGYVPYRDKQGRPLPIFHYNRPSVFRNGYESSICKLVDHLGLDVCTATFLSPEAAEEIIRFTGMLPDSDQEPCEIYGKFIHGSSLAQRLETLEQRVAMLEASSPRN